MKKYALLLSLTAIIVAIGFVAHFEAKNGLELRRPCNELYVEFTPHIEVHQGIEMKVGEDMNIITAHTYDTISVESKIDKDRSQFGVNVEYKIIDSIRYEKILTYDCEE